MARAHAGANNRARLTRAINDANAGHKAANVRAVRDGHKAASNYRNKVETSILRSPTPSGRRARITLACEVVRDLASNVVVSLANRRTTVVFFVVVVSTAHLEALPPP